MNYILAGTGNMAYFLGRRLHQAGWTCCGVYGRQLERAQHLATLTHATHSGTLSEVAETADCCILAVSDVAIASVGAGWHFQEMTVVHTAGSVSVDTLSARHRAVLWPIYSILKDAMPEHRNMPIIWEGSSPKARQVVQQIASIITDLHQEASFDQRKHLHLAAVISNNFTNHLMTITEALCREQGLSFDLLKPIIRQTAARIAHTSPATLQTGPAKRDDEQTMQQHLNLLTAHPAWQQVYSALSEAIKKWYNDPVSTKG